MAQKYNLAAKRHLVTGDHLLSVGEFNDAGYHYGFAGENSLKHAMRLCGISIGMYKHFPMLGGELQASVAVIKLSAKGRLANPLLTAPPLQNRFKGWHTLIRYEDTGYCPVSATSATTWKADAEQLAAQLLI